MTYTPGPWKACYSDQVGGGNIRSDHHRDGTGALLLEAGPMFHDYTPDRDEELANLRLAAACVGAGRSRHRQGHGPGGRACIGRTTRHSGI